MLLTKETRKLPNLNFSCQNALYNFINNKLKLSESLYKVKSSQLNNYIAYKAETVNLWAYSDNEDVKYS